MSWSYHPEPTAQQKALDWSILKKLWPFARPHKRLLYLSLVLAPLASAVQIARPYLVKLAIDGPIAQSDLSGLLQLVILFAGLMIAETLVTYVQMLALQLVGQRIIRTLREKMFAHLMTLGRQFLQARPAGVLVTRLTNDLEAVNEFFASGVVNLLTDVVTLTGIALVMLWLNPGLTGATFVAVPFMLLLGIWFRNRLRESYRSIRRRLAKLNGFMTETLSGIETVQNIGVTRKFASRFDEYNEEHRLANMRSIGFDASLYAVVEALGAIATGALLWYGGGLKEQGNISFGELVAFIEYIAMFFAPLRDLSQKYAVMQSAMASGERIFELLDEKAEITGGSLTSVDAKALHIELHDLHFGYRQDEEILHGISLRAQKGEKIALVGTSGSGKTTTVRLMQRQYDPWSGSIDFCASSLSAYDLGTLRRRIAVVEQHTFLFSGTLAHNLRMYDESLTDERLLEVAEAVGLMDRFHNLDLPIREAGSNLSQGEKQLIALARAVLRDPLVLILDEATSAVDPILEAQVYQAARQAAQGRILISIAHRLGTVRDADRIYVFRGGSIVEEGSHPQLLSANGYYARLMAYQTLLGGEENSAHGSLSDS